MVRTLLVASAFAAVSAGIAAPPASAWGADGHRIVSRIAAFRLSPGVSASLAELLPPGETLVDAGLWADEIRSDPQWRWTDRLHWVDVPGPGDELVPERDCPRAECILGAIERYRAVLGDRDAPTRSRRQALRFLVHLVADLHQPLHVAHREDRGGNDVEVRFFGRPTTLHRVWDGGLLEERAGWWWGGGDPAAVADRLASAITPSEAAAWRAGELLDWARESLALARSHAYGGVEDGDSLGWLYTLRAVAPLEERLSRAGERLAMLLEEALGEAPEPRRGGAFDRRSRDRSLRR